MLWPDRYFMVKVNSCICLINTTILSHNLPTFSREVRLWFRHKNHPKKCLFLGDSCNTHNNLRGVCIELPSCESLIQLYRDDRSQRTIDILVANQQNCGNRKVGRNPLMCCSDGVQQSTPPPPVPQELNARGPACSTPDNLNGFCINVKECPAVLDEFLKRRNDPEYVRFIQQSNANCNYERQAICCPNQSPPPSQNQQNNQQQTSSNTASRLAEPDQCGVSKVPHNRVVGGVPAKKGKKRIIFKFNDIELLVGFPNIFSLSLLILGG